MAKMSDLPLSDLYEKKMTGAVEAAIMAKEDFSEITPAYCEKVCRLKCKQPQTVRLLNQQVDILIIQDVNALNGKWDKFPGQAEKNIRKVVEFVCEQAGFGGLSYRLVNLLKCELTEKDLGKGNKPPTQVTISKCKPYLLSEIERCKPKVIISLSTAVTKALGYSKHSNTGNRGEIVDNRVVITLHPRVLTMIRQNASGAMWGADYMGIIVRDFEKAAKLARGELVIPDQKTAINFFAQNRIRIARTIQDVREFIEILFSLHETSIVSLDTETTGLDGMAEDARVITIQFGYRDPIDKNIKSLVIPLWHRANTGYTGQEAWEFVAPWLLSDRPKVLHNAKFDLLYIYHTTGVRVKNVVFDTMLILHDLDSGAQGTFSLKTAVHDYLPHLGFQGYEELLPPLTKTKKVVENETEEEVEEQNG